MVAIHEALANAVRKTPYFTKMKWIFTSIPKLVLTGICAGSKSA
nr:hypothetical protein [Klebsiella pneumoniae]